MARFYIISAGKNCAKWIRHNLYVLNVQTHKDWRFILIDDNSDDGTYTEENWNNEEFKDYTFAFQAKDSASNVQGVPDNETEIGEYIGMIGPTDFINYFNE